MRLHALFHISFYCTLALAAASLTAPSVFFLWWMPYFLAAALGFFFLAWRYEGTWVLSETAANQLGVFIAVGAAGWILFQVPRSVEELAIGGVNWPAGLLPHLGPLLMILLTVKLFRPKRLPDYWVIQTMGLMMVALAAVLADDRLFGLLVVCYFASLVWSLGLFYHVRERALVNAEREAHHVDLFGGVVNGRREPLPWRLGGVPRTAVWTANIAVLGFLLFLCAPRQGQSHWNARQLSTGPASSSKTGSDAGIDLNRVGVIELSDDPAFTVTVHDRHGRLIDPAQIKHWRQETLEIYSQGRWYPQRRVRELEPASNAQSALQARTEPAHLEDHQWLIKFQVIPRDAGGLVLAEPVDFELGAGLEPWVDNKLQEYSFFALPEGWDTFVSWPYKGPRKMYSYSQVIPARGELSLTPARGVNEAFYAATLARYPVPPKLAEWTRELLPRLSELSDADRRLNARQQLDESGHAKVAQALCNYLALSGEYRYSLELRRHNLSLDPAVDFLLNIKEGHCERYAGGLALMLRSLGVPCRVVKGYLGAESDELGHGVIRKSQAHSWVQALVPGQEPDEFQWLTLDPMPTATAPDSMLVSWWNWCKLNILDSRVFWRQFILDYTPDQQLDLLATLQRLFTSKRGWFAILFVAGTASLVITGPRFGRRLAGWVHCWLTGPARSTAVAVSFYDELLRLLRRYGDLTPQPSQTPREFAERVAAILEREPGVNGITDALLHVVETYYQVRYGGRLLDAAAHAEIAQNLNRLRQRLVQIAS